jgi:hypothetical protein
MPARDAPPTQAIVLSGRGLSDPALPEANPRREGRYGGGDFGGSGRLSLHEERLGSG